MRPHAASSSCAQLMRMQSMPCSSRCWTSAVVVGRFARHGDHDGHAAIGRNGPKHGLGMRIQQPPARFEIDGGLVRLVGLPGAPERAVEHRKHRVDRGQHVRFRAPERRQARPREPHLQRPEVAAAQREVVQQVHRALALARVDLRQHVKRLLRQLNEIAADPKDLVDQFLELTIRFWLARALRP